MKSIFFIKRGFFESRGYSSRMLGSQLVTSRSRTGEDGMKIKRRWDDHPYEPHLLAECVSIVVATMVVILRVPYDGAGRAKLEPAI